MPILCFWRRLWFLLVFVGRAGQCCRRSGGDERGGGQMGRLGRRRMRDRPRGNVAAVRCRLEFVAGVILLVVGPRLVGPARRQPLLFLEDSAEDVPAADGGEQPRLPAELAMQVGEDGGHLGVHFRMIAIVASGGADGGREGGGQFAGFPGITAADPRIGMVLERNQPASVVRTIRMVLGPLRWKLCVKARSTVLAFSPSGDVRMAVVEDELAIRMESNT